MSSFVSERLEELLKSGIITRGLYDDLNKAALKDRAELIIVQDSWEHLYEAARQSYEAVNKKLERAIDDTSYYRDKALSYNCKILRMALLMEDLAYCPCSTCKHTKQYGDYCNFVLEAVDN